MKRIGQVLIVIGVLMLAAVLLASPLHIYGTGFGPRHIMGTVVGAIILVAGIIVVLIPKQKSVGN